MKAQPVQVVQEALEGRGLRAGRAWRCPSHDDRNPSLSVNAGTDGRALLRCHAGCETDRVLADLGLSMADLFPEETPPGAGAEIIETYPYEAEDGSLLYEAVRMWPKDFRVRRPDSDGDWTWNLNGTRRVPFRLPQVLQAVKESRPIYIVEGERDVRSVERAEGVATCNVGGAGKWRAEYNEHFVGADVLIVADRDEPGRDHAEKIASGLQGVARSIRRMEPREGKDITDHLAAGLTLGDLISTEPEAKAPRSMVELLARPPAVAPCLLEPALVVEGGLTVIAAPTKVGKTNLWLHLAWAMTDGKPLWNTFVPSRPVPVLMIQLELSEATMHERLKVLQAELGWSAEAQARFYVHCERALLLDRKGGVERLLEIIAECPEKPAFVILDSYNASVAGDPDKSAEARRALHAMRKVQDETGIAWGVTAEIRKAPAGTRIRYSIDDLKGSNELAYDCDAMLMLRPTDEKRRRLGLGFLAMRHLSGEEPEGLTLVRQGLTFQLTESATRDEREDAIRSVLRKHLAGGGDSSWRACVAVVRQEGIRVRDELVGKIRAELLGGS